MIRKIVHKNWLAQKIFLVFCNRYKHTCQKWHGYFNVASPGQRVVSRIRRWKVDVNTPPNYIEIGRLVTRPRVTPKPVEEKDGKVSTPKLDHLIGSLDEKVEMEVRSLFRIHTAL